MWPTLDRISVFSTKKRRGQIFSDWVGRRPAAAALGFCPDGCNLGFLPGGAFGATCVSLQRPPSGQGKGVPGAGGMHSWVLPGWPRARLLKTSCSPSPATVSLARRGPSIACAATTWEGWLVVVSNRESGSPGIHPVGLSPAPCSAVGSRCQTGTLAKQAVRPPWGTPGDLCSSLLHCLQSSRYQCRRLWPPAGRLHGCG